MCVLFILLLLHSHWFSSRHFQVTFRALRKGQDLNINMASSTRRSFGQGELSGRPIARPNGSANYNDGRGQFGQRFSQLLLLVVLLGVELLLLLLLLLLLS